MNVINPQPVSDLISLVFSDTVSSYSFVGSTYSYNSLLVLNASNSVTLTPTGSDTITINDSVVTSGSPSGAIDLTDGTQKTITVLVSGEGKISKTYYLYLTKIVTTGGTITNGAGYRVHRFTSGSAFTSNISLTTLLLVVGGGGAGGAYDGGGGDGGDLYYNASYAVSSGSTSVTIGAGGNATGQYAAGPPGGSSSFGVITESGGSGGGKTTHTGGDGAGGSGGSYDGDLGYGPANTGTGGGAGKDATFAYSGGSGVVIVRINAS